VKNSTPCCRSLHLTGTQK